MNVTVSTIQIRRGNTTAWTNSNRVLLEGEFGYDTTLKKHKIGDGVTAWLDLDFIEDALLGGTTFTGDVNVPDEAYDASTWNGSTEVPTKNAVRDKIESLSLGGATWGGISGTLSSQTDLQAALDAKANLSGATFTGQVINSTNGAASTPPEKLTGTWFSGGTATTTKPQLLVEPSGTTSTGWSTSGTGLGINAATGFTGNLIDAQINGTNKFKVDYIGNLTAAASISSGSSIYPSSTGYLNFLSRSAISSPADGNLRLTNNATTDFSLLQFGGTTSSFPALKRNGANLEAKLADDSAFTYLTGIGLIGNSLVQTGASGYYSFSGRSRLYSDADGNLRLSNNASSAFSLLQFGGTTSSFPALKRNSAGLDLRLADDSAYALLTGRFSATPTATNAGFNFGSVAGDPSTPTNGDAWYDSTNNLLRARINGATVSLGAGGGGGSYNESTPITDSSSNELLKFTKVASAVNEFTISNNSTGNAPELSVTSSSDSNRGMVFAPLGTGAVSVWTVNGSAGLVLESGTYGSKFASSYRLEMSNNAGNVSFTKYGGQDINFTSGSGSQLRIKTDIYTYYSFTRSFVLPEYTPSALAANTNDWNLAQNWERSPFWRVSASSAVDLTGLVPTNMTNAVLYFTNVGANTITLKHDSASSTAANRFYCSTGADIALAQHGVAMLWYDNTSTRWRVAKMF